MGTNYYAFKKATDEVKVELKKLIDEEKFDKLFDEIPQRIHIGKSSAGWQFCFNHNDEQFYQKSRESLVEFLRDCVLVDEYGRIQDQVEFWDFVDSKAHKQGQGEYGEFIGGLTWSNGTDFS